MTLSVKIFIIVLLGFNFLKSHVKAYEHWVNPAEIETDIKNLLSQFRNLDEL